MTFTAVALTFALFATLLLAYRYLVRPVLIAVLSVSGILVMLIEARRLELQVFTWVKVFTLAISLALIVTRGRVTGRRAQILSWAIVGMLALNILEAIVADAVAGAWFNALAGLSLIATQRGAEAVDAGVDPAERRIAVTYDLPWSWLFAYTAWNLAFVCRHYPHCWLDHAAVLAASLAAVLLVRDRRRWLEARAFTLGMLAVIAGFAHEVARCPWIPSPPLPAFVLPAATGLSCALAAWNAIARRRMRREAWPAISLEGSRT
ncbi:MAG: hypothetical protein HZA93_13980 [Verrucomicrobia bacterium]|nr:hypothetical protein [Verrucomicrobiota bacterium]